MSTNDTIYNNNNFYFENTFSQSNLVTKRVRSLFFFATPLDINGRRYKTFNDDPHSQTDHFTDFTKEVEDDITGYNSDTMDIKLFSIAWREYLINTYVLQDFGLVAVSFTCVLLYVSFHLQSFFLGTLSMIGIGFAYPLTIFINRFIFQITYFTVLNYVAIFVILGIAADDVFVFTDSWKQTATYKLLNDEDTKQKNLIKRMNYTWRRTAKAILTTSLTTCVSFYATGFSRIMPISAFGFFSGTLVIAVYSFAITSYPCCVIIFEKYLADKCKYRHYIGLLCKKICKW